MTREHAIALLTAHVSADIGERAEDMAAAERAAIEAFRVLGVTDQELARPDASGFVPF